MQHVNSIKRVSVIKNNYDVVIIDEVEQVLQHLTGSTLQSRRRSVIPSIFNRIRAASQVFCLDADLSSLTVDTMADIVGEDTPVTFIHNDYKHGGTVNVYDSLPNLVEQTVQDINDGKKVYFTSNSKALIAKVASHLSGVKYIIVTQETTSEEEVHRFISNINEECKNYQVVFASPTLSTGVDITTQFDVTYGAFYQQPLTHYDIDQQIWRTRNTSKVNVWISNNVYKSETNWERIRAVIVNSNRKNLGLLKTTDNYDKWEEIYLNLVARVMAHRNISMNNLRSNWISMRENDGYSIVFHEKVETDFQIDTDLAKDQRKAQRFAGLMNAEGLTEEEYTDLKFKKDKTQYERYSQERYEIEDAYDETISEELIEHHDEDLHTYAKRYKRFVSDVDKVIDTDISQLGGELTIADRDKNIYKVTLLYKLLSSIDLQDLDCDVELSKHDVDQFITLAQEMKTTLEVLFGVKVRTDADKKAMQVVNSIVKQAGVRLSVSRISQPTTKGKKSKLYYYSIDQDWMNIVEHYSRRIS